jgi:hypothetical protein
MLASVGEQLTIFDTDDITSIPLTSIPLTNNASKPTNNTAPDHNHDHLDIGPASDHLDIELDHTPVPDRHNVNQVAISEC